MGRGGLALAVAAALACGCGAGEGICDGAALEAALADATPGSTVVVGACRVEGRFEIPAGVTLRGQGADRSTLARSAGNVVVVEAGEVAIEQVRIESASAHGVVAVGASSLTLAGVEIHATAGRAALGLEGVATVRLTDVAISGPVTAENAIELPEIPTATDTALYGIVMIDVPSATMERVSVGGFGWAGLAASGSGLTWTGGGASSNLGLGVWLIGGTTTLSGIAIRDTLRGFRGEPTYGLAVNGGADLTTIDLVIEGSEGGFGILQDGGSARHEGLAASGHDAGGIIVQRTTTFALVDADVHDNDFGGVIAVEAGGLLVEGSTISTTRSVARAMSAWGMVMVGDGLQLVRPMTGSVVRDTLLESNERAGLLVELGGGDTSALTLETVIVSASGTAFGCVAQNGSVVTGWDGSVTRAGEAAANDASFTGGIDIVGVIGPSDIPPADALVGVIGPSD